MASILESLSQGLRGAGAVMSPSVYNTQAQEMENERSRSQRNKEVVLGLLANAAENGAISPEIFQQKAQELGLGNVPIGPSMQTRKYQDELALRSGRTAAQVQFFKPREQQPVQQTIDPMSGAIVRPMGVGGDAQPISTSDFTAPARMVDGDKYNPRQDPAAWLAYSAEREQAGDIEEANRARTIAKTLSDEVAPKMQVIGNRPYAVSPTIENGSTTGFSVEPIAGEFGDAKDPWSGVTPSQYTPESLEAYNASIKEGQPNRALLRVNPKQTAEASAARIINQVGDDAFTELVKGGAKNIVKAQEEAENAAATINVVHNARRELDKGAFTGFGANVALGFGRVLSLAGFDGAKDPVANTQAYAAYTGNLVGQIIKQFGAGTGLSDADREYAQKIAGGDITLDEKALRRLLDLNEKGLRILAERYNAKAKKIDDAPQMKNVPFKFSVDVPGEYTPPEGSKEALKKKYGLE